MKKMTRKWALLITVVVAIAGCAVAATLSAQTTDFTLMINGKVVETEKPIVAIDNSSYLPVRELSEKLGFDVTWHERFFYFNVIDIRTSPMGEIYEIVRDRIEMDLPDDTKVLNYKYIAKEDYVLAKISVSHKDIERMIEQLEKRYGKDSEAGREGLNKSKEDVLADFPPYMTNVSPWWDLDKAQVEYAYGETAVGRYLPMGQIRTKFVSVCILKEVDGRHLVYIKY